MCTYYGLCCFFYPASDWPGVGSIPDGSKESGPCWGGVCVWGPWFCPRLCWGSVWDQCLDKWSFLPSSSLPNQVEMQLLSSLSTVPVEVLRADAAVLSSSRAAEVCTDHTRRSPRKLLLVTTSTVLLRMTSAVRADCLPLASMSNSRWPGLGPFYSTGPPVASGRVATSLQCVLGVCSLWITRINWVSLFLSHTHILCTHLTSQITRSETYLRKCNIFII